MDPSASASLSIDADRLWSRLMTMAIIGATPSGGCNRQALTREDREGRELLMQWARAAGCQTRVDAIGNLFLRHPGLDDDLPAVLTGSHLDTQPTGGKFDGVYGVLAGLEAVESLRDRGLLTRHPIEVAVWCNEEGCRFPIAMLGSAVWAGRVPLSAAHALVARDGPILGDELRRIGAPIDQPIVRQALRATLEVHIEQGPVLERERCTIGIVTGVQHMSRHEIIVHGQEAHAGPTPMDMRRDPIRVLSELLPAFYAAAAARGPGARMTVGLIETLPGSPNTVPGRLRFTCDLRHPDSAVYRDLVAEVHALVSAALVAHRLEGEIRCVWEAPGVAFDTDCINAVRRAVASLGHTSLELVSGAGHDSCNVAAVAPTAMIFVPCAGGLSHNEAEDAAPADLAAGASVLLRALVDLAGGCGPATPVV